MLLNLYSADSMFLSHINHEHPYYKAFVLWGKEYPEEMIPWLLKHLDVNWDIAVMLWEIVGQEKAPHVPEEHAGRRDYIVEQWLAWGKLNGYVL